MLIIAVVVAVTIGITKAKLDNVVSYTYYNAYSTLRKISTEMLADWDPKDPEYKQALNSNDFIAGIKNPVSIVKDLKDNILGIYRDMWSQPAYAKCARWYIEVGKSCKQSGGQQCSSLDEEGSGCFECCTRKCTKECSPGYRLDYNSCTCKQIGVTCWDGSVASNAASCPKAECWDGSQAPNPSSCPPKINCWDGSFATSQSNCPSYVTCWNGNKAHNWSECPSCPNKPSCPVNWDDKTCTGTSKTCPASQHLNSSCNCVIDCPTDLSPCNICNSETGIVSQNPAINRTCSDEAYEWSEEQCKCIPSPRTLPRKGMNFCKLFERHTNIMSGSSVCSGSVISSGTTDFSNKSPDITLRNGLRIYNMHSDAGAISMLANNTQGGVYDGVPNTNSYGYTVYVDIDGSKGDSQLWIDVYPFYITLSGKIIPAYDTSNSNSSGGDSVRHLQVSAENENYASGRRSTKWLARSVSFKEGACISGYVGDATPYCKNGTSFTKAGECTTNYNSMCRVKQIMPVKFFF